VVRGHRKYMLITSGHHVWPADIEKAAARIDGFRAGNIAAVRYRTAGLRPRVRLRRAPVNLRSTEVGS
jgi:hypothetical protein